MSAKPDRRGFLKLAAGVAAVAAVGREALAQEAIPTPVPKRARARSGRQRPTVQGVVIKGADGRLFFLTDRQLAGFEVIGDKRRVLESQIKVVSQRQTPLLTSREASAGGLPVASTRDVLFVDLTPDKTGTAGIGTCNACVVACALMPTP